MKLMDEDMNRLVALLLELIAKKTSLLQKILVVTKNQVKALDEEGVDSLAGFLNEKQEYINRIDQLDREFNRIYSQFESKPIQLAAALQPAIARVQDLVQEISILEKDNLERIKKSIDEVKNQLKGINNGKRGLNAYKKAAHIQHRTQIDKPK